MADAAVHPVSTDYVPPVVVKIEEIKSADVTVTPPPSTNAYGEGADWVQIQNVHRLTREQHLAAELERQARVVAAAPPAPADAGPPSKRPKKAHGQSACPQGSAAKRGEPCTRPLTRFPPPPPPQTRRETRRSSGTTRGWRWMGMCVRSFVARWRPTARAGLGTAAVTRTTWWRTSRPNPPTWGPCVPCFRNGASARRGCRAGFTGGTRPPRRRRRQQQQQQQVQTQQPRQKRWARAPPPSRRLKSGTRRS